MPSEIWTEKYRPSKLDNILCNGNELELITLLVRSDHPLPHLLFYGVEGIGKTTIALAIAKEVLGKYFRTNSLIINASLKGGIDTVRERIVSFGRQTTIGGSPFKIIIMEEYDNASKQNQQSLRKVMEDFAKNNRFILTANFEKKIIAPIKSRCAIFHIKPLKMEQIRERLQYIAKKEQVQITDKAIFALAKSSRGRMRNGINLLAKYAILNRPIKFADVAREGANSEIGVFLKAVFSSKSITQGMTVMFQLFEDQGYTEEELIEEVMQKFMKSKFSDKIKSKVAQISANTSYQIAVGSPPEVAIMGFLGKLYDLSLKLKKRE